MSGPGTAKINSDQLIAGLSTTLSERGTTKTEVPVVHTVQAAAEEVATRYGSIHGSQQKFELMERDRVGFLAGERGGRNGRWV